MMASHSVHSYTTNMALLLHSKTPHTAICIHLHDFLLLIQLKIHNSGGVGGLAGLALAGALFGLMNINIKLLIGPPHFTHHYALLLRTHEICGSSQGSGAGRSQRFKLSCATCAQLNQHQHELFGQHCSWQTCCTSQCNNCQCNHTSL